jgi:abhydrolase domain-containing protein 1/3
MIKRFLSIPKWKMFVGVSTLIIGEHIYDCLYNTEVEVFY